MPTENKTCVRCKSTLTVYSPDKIEDPWYCPNCGNKKDVPTYEQLSIQLQEALAKLEKLEKLAVHGHIVEVGSIEVLDDKPGMVISCSIEELRNMRGLAFKDIIIVRDPDKGLSKRPPMPPGTVLWTSITGAGLTVVKDPGGDFVFDAKTCMGGIKPCRWEFYVGDNKFEFKIASWPVGQDMLDWYKDKLWEPEQEETD